MNQMNHAHINNLLDDSKKISILKKGIAIKGVKIMETS